ncbi:PepSY domain-containing protein [Halomonas sp. ATCH28]|uniref:PepSY domain-containing protein n=1 Tax=Halomonas gemina TaxID=2945105 RepID=A0ABT0T5D2_9GAMM|nr:PepSY domain-containing protein [Halomonas gemina]MCL7941721.1 PepSY domain-containing protein [Halomonas gemina]
MTFKTTLMGSMAALMLAAGAAQADDRLAMERLDGVLEHATAFGFTHFEEIEAKSGNSVEVEGWLDDEWYADARLSLDSGESLKEERKRLITGAWGMREDDVRQAFDVAISEGMIEFEEINIDEAGKIEIEGRDADGREIEITTRLGESGVIEVEHD